MAGKTLTLEISSALRIGKAFIAALFLTMSAGTATALPFPSPDPGTLSDDLDGSGYFNVGSLGNLAFELFDLGDSGAIFGFFDQNAPGNLVPIFGASDLTGEAAIIDFANGYVFDIEDATVQSTFAATNSVGFYLDFASFILYSDPTLNLGGLDVMGEFESTSSNFLSLLFFDGPADSPRRSLLSWHAISDVTSIPNIDPVPVPATWLLITLGLGFIATRKRRNRSSH